MSHRPIEAFDRIGIITGAFEIRDIFPVAIFDIGKAECLFVGQVAFFDQIFELRARAVIFSIRVELANSTTHPCQAGIIWRWRDHFDINHVTIDIHLNLDTLGR